MMICICHLIQNHTLSQPRTQKTVVSSQNEQLDTVSDLHPLCSVLTNSLRTGSPRGRASGGRSLLSISVEVKEAYTEAALTLGDESVPAENRAHLHKELSKAGNLRIPARAEPKERVGAILSLACKMPTCHIRLLAQFLMPASCQ